MSVIDNGTFLHHQWEEITFQTVCSRGFFPLNVRILTLLVRILPIEREDSPPGSWGFSPLILRIIPPLHQDSPNWTWGFFPLLVRIPLIDLEDSPYWSWGFSLLVLCIRILRIGRENFPHWSWGFSPCSWEFSLLVLKILPVNFEDSPPCSWGFSPSNMIMKGKVAKQEGKVKNMTILFYLYMRKDEESMLWRLGA